MSPKAQATSLVVILTLVEVALFAAAYLSAKANNIIAALAFAAAALTILAIGNSIVTIRSLLIEIADRL